MKRNASRPPLSRFFSGIARSQTLRRLVVILLLISILPALAIFASMYTISSHLLQQEIQAHSRNALMDARGNVNDIIRQAEDVVLGMAINSNVNALLAEDRLAVGSASRASLRNLMENTLKVNRSVLNMIYIETPENTVYAFTVDEKVSPYDIRISGSEYEQPVLAKRGAPLWFGLTDSTFPEEKNAKNREYVRCAAAITDASGTRCLGILSLFLKTSALDHCLSEQYYSDDRQILLLLDRGNRIIASNKDVDDALALELTHTDLGSSPDSLTLCDVPYLFSSLDSENTGWRLVSLTPRSAAMRALNGTWRLLIPLLFLPLVCALLACFFAKNLLNMLRPMLETMNEIKAGNLSVRAPRIQDATFDLFGQTLNETLDKYHELVVFSGHQEALLTISRLKLLRGQLSPHFLYNILDSVNWMLLENGQYETSRIITDLGYILRYSINESSDTVPLCEEIDVIERYLSISQHRFESRLNYSIYVAPVLTDYQIPRFLLQPIVENAVIHGVERSAASSTLTIRCYTTPECVTIDISNDGPSISPETKAGILESFSQSGGSGIHIGLKNVYERIQLFYGPEYGLSLLDLEPHGTLIRLRLPPPCQSKEVPSA